MTHRVLTPRALTLLSLLALPLALACGDKDGTDSGTTGPDGEICDDGLDNDGDGQADCADSDCADKPVCQDDTDTDTDTDTDGGGEDSGETGGDTGETGDDTGTTEPPPQLWVNEFMASNASTVTDESGAYPDWIELYNPNDAAVSLDGWHISDDAAEPDKHALDGSLSVPAGGFLVLFADDDEEDGPRHVGFNLSADGEEVVLTGPDGSTVDVVAYGPQSTDVSAARVPDGGETWTLADPATPGESNGEAR